MHMEFGEDILIGYGDIVLTDIVLTDKQTHRADKICDW